jgi:hypothetical protein
MLIASLEALRPPYLGTIESGNGVFLSEGAYCVEDPYGVWEPPLKPWFEMDFRGPDSSPAENRRLVGNCIVLGFDGGSRDYYPCDAAITVEELAKFVHFHWHSPQPEVAESTTPS